VQGTIARELATRRAAPGARIGHLAGLTTSDRRSNLAAARPPLAGVPKGPPQGRAAQSVGVGTAVALVAGAAITYVRVRAAVTRARRD
jgi:hypothetical protein